jgi:hypothetical protein
MIAQAASLVQFFDFDNAAVRKDGLAALGGTGAMRGVQALLTAAPLLLQNHALESATEALQEALNVRIVDILAAAWNTRQELRQYLDRSRFPANQIIDHTIAKHDVHSSHKPRLQIMLDQSPVGPEIEFDVIVGLTVEAAVLRIQDARIMGARMGKIFGTGTIKCEGATLFSRPTKAVNLPLTVSFGTGIAIGKTTDATIANAA